MPHLAEEEQNHIPRAMRQPSFYPHPTQDPIRMVQTHISHVFLTGPFAYKVKRPVNFGFLNFSTLQARHHYCLLELSRNQSYAPELYLEVVPIRFGAAGFSLTGHGKIVDYAVKMHQFDERFLFSRMFLGNRLEARHLEKLGRRLAAVHAGAEWDPVKAERYGSASAVQAVVADNYQTGERFLGRLHDKQHNHAVKTFTDHLFHEQQDLFTGRVQNGMVRLCHGDLHLNNVCWYNEDAHPFDCIEFNDAFSIIDVLYDCAFMVMDLENRNRGDLAFAFFNAWFESVYDIEGLQLLPFYLNLRAYVRAKVYSLMAEDETQSADSRSEKEGKAAHFYELAYRYTQARPRRAIIVCGLSGSGKSTVAAWLAGQLTAIHLRSDAIRKHLAGIPTTQKGDSSLYKPAFSEKTYARLIEDAGRVLDAGFSVVLDAKFDRRDQRDQARAALLKRGVSVDFIHCRARLETLAQRLTDRVGDVSDAGPDLLESQTQSWQPFSVEDQVLELNTEHHWRARLGDLLGRKP
ncbi:bifunctional aminoglycoside phosphotransferase/ATP-binding protein [Acanthopleuribacter pedis]|uniref:AAA family ATPase n=1 Tax=Acanthopleuribacter pedis TaxID=442870 RepID=A0A8J7U118_9BACT|nr:bifunctional aminoglycoside phosphotransferase/ATP-binding protein [Acanthopleuribacter pedis]MBO1317688.1 AAA family ATPase [Acanthopleuribacter pedis]